MHLPASFNPFLPFLGVGGKPKQTTALFTSSYMRATKCKAVRHLVELPGSYKTKVKVHETYRALSQRKDYRQHLVHCSIEAEAIMDMYSGKFYRYCNHGPWKLL